MRIKSILKLGFEYCAFLAVLLVALATVERDAALGAGRGGGGFGGGGRTSTGAGTAGSSGFGNRIGTGNSIHHPGFFHGIPGSSIRPAWHSWRFHHHRPFLIFPAFGYPFYGYSCYGPFWPYFSYNPCRNYYSAWPSPFVYSPLGNELASVYTAPAELQSADENKDTERITNSSLEANAFIRQAENALKSGDYQLAVRAWRHAVVEDPGNGTTIMMLAQALFAAGDYDEAAAAAEQAMMLLPEHEWSNVAKKFRGLYGNIQDYSNQVNALASAVEKYPNDPALRFELGFQYAYSDHPDLALPQLDKLLELVPQDQIGRKLRDQVNKEKKSASSPAS